MSDTRRSFLHSTAAIATGIGGASLMAQTQQPAAPPRAASEIQVPKMKFGKYEVSRLIAGCNPFYGFSHFNKNVDTAMREYFTPDRVRAVLHQCSRFGINTFNYYPGGRGPADFESFLAEGGQMNLIIQGMNDFMPSVKAFKPMAIYCQGEIVDKALAKAKARVDEGKSSLARATLRKVAEDLEREERERHREQEERRAIYVERVTALYNRERDIALASYDGEAAAEAVIALAETVHGVDRAGVYKALKAEAQAHYQYGRNRCSNVHLVAAIALSRKLLDVASSDDGRGAAHVWLGNALLALGERESGTARLDEAVAAYREALKERTPEAAPYCHDQTQENLAICLALLEQRRKS